MSLLDDLKEWTDADAAALALGRVLGVFDADTSLASAKATLWTNNAAGNTLYGMLERLARIGVLDWDEEQRRYRAAPPSLHPLSAVDGVPALEGGLPARAHIEMSLASPESFRLQADRAGFRFLARVFDEIADSGLESGWGFRRDERFAPAAGTSAAAGASGAAGAAEFSFVLVDPDADGEK
jgi:hypothetical protein